MTKHRLFDEDVLVIGLGRFGAAAALEMDRLGYRVHAVETNNEVAERFSRRLLRVLSFDSTNPDELRKVKPQDFRVAVVGIGSSVEGSLLTAGNLVDAGVASIWAKAVSAEHARLLERIGVHHVVFPEAEAGGRVAHLVNDKMEGYIEFEDGYAIVKMRPPQEMIGFSLLETDIRKRYGVTVVGLKAPGEDFTHALPETKVGPHHIMIVSGPSKLIEQLASRP
ncbi:potassium channel family protein [Ornithinimicrobium sediminis]|uniref:potassium channel family protein n=1 Tax=Ornithinimicrobium sediminis TaxID=2904603 RepID=UPI001E44381A|nr:TrkA family potassium uptake protein [Ornithinimicrobium sediminis]MCE0485772.1 TrkA family potassium uptake protein [Ornithinimicrobium sediminis]